MRGAARNRNSLLHAQNARQDEGTHSTANQEPLESSTHQPDPGPSLLARRGLEVQWTRVGDYGAVSKRIKAAVKEATGEEPALMVQWLDKGH